MSDSVRMMKGSTEDVPFTSYARGKLRFVLIKKENICVAVIIKGLETEELIDDMRTLAQRLIDRYQDKILHWDGRRTSLEGIDKIVTEFSKSQKYQERVSRTSEELKFMLINKLSSYIYNLCSEKIVIITIDDLHHADSLTCAFLYIIGKNIANKKIMVIGTYNREELLTPAGTSTEFQKVLTRLKGESLIKEIAIENFDESTTEELILSLTKTDVDTGFLKNIAENIFTRTVGNPLFVKELITWIISSAPDKALFETYATGHENVRDIIQRRIGAFPREFRFILELASIFPTAIYPDILSSEVNITKVHLLRILNELINYGIIKIENEKYYFTNLIIRDTIYQSIPQNLLPVYHEATAVYIESHFPIREKIIELAYHYYKSGNYEKAKKYLTEAYEYARREHSNHEARTFALRKYEILQKHNAPIKEIINTVLEIGKTSYDIGDITGSIEYFDKALRLLNANKKTIANEYDDYRIIINEQLGELYLLQNAPEKGAQYFNEILMTTFEKENITALVNVHLGLAKVSVLNDDFEKARALLNLCLDIARNKNYTEGIIRIYLELSNILMMERKMDMALPLLNEALSLADSENALYYKWQILHQIGKLFSQKSLINDAVLMFTKSNEIANSIGNLRGMVETLLSLAIIKTGNAGLNYANEALKIVRRFDDIRLFIRTYTTLAMIYYVNSQQETAQKYIDDAIKIAKREKLHYQLGKIYKEFGELVIKNNFALGKDYLQKALYIFENVQAYREVQEVQNVIKCGMQIAEYNQ